MNAPCIALISAIVAIVAGCSAPVPQPVAASAPRVEFHSQPYAEAFPNSDDDSPRFCRLGSDCMQLDSRPFAPCYAATEPCQGEGVFMRATPSIIFKPADIEPLLNLPPKK